MRGGKLLRRPIASIASVSLAGCCASHPPSTDAAIVSDAPTRPLYGSPCDGCDIAYADGFSICVPTPIVPTARCAPIEQFARGHGGAGKEHGARRWRLGR